MTDQSKIPLPDSGDGAKGGSLLERASGFFGLDPFRPAKRDGLLPPQPRKRALRQPELPAAAPVLPEPPAPAPVAAPAAAAPTAAPPPVEPPVPLVTFRARPHPIDRAHLRENGIIVPESSTTALVEEFRIAKRQLLSSAKAAGTAKARRVLICSPLPGEGKTFCATNLAVAMAAERDSEVVLVDADFAKPSVLSTLGLPARPGFMDALADPAVAIEDLVLGTDIPGLWVLPAGNQTNADSEYLASARTGELLDRLTLGAPNRMVVFDTPPALAASPAAELAKHVGQAVLVVRADYTGRNALDDSYQLLSACPDIKLLFNGATFSPSGRRFGTYYGYEG